MIVSIVDFEEGKYELSTGMYDEVQLDNYILKYEPFYLINLLGAELYDEFIADLNLGAGYPTEQRFIDIFESFHKDYNHCIYISNGIKEMLIGYIYYEYLKDQINQITPIGNVVSVGENSENPKTLYSTMYNRFNESARTQKAIQKYICENSENYEKFNGRYQEFAYWI